MPVKPEMLCRVTETAADFPAGTVRKVVLRNSWKCGPDTVTGTVTDC